MTCDPQGKAYTDGWRVRMSDAKWWTVDKHVIRHFQKGWHDADRRMKCTAMYAGYNDRRESHEHAR